MIEFTRLLFLWRAKKSLPCKPHQSQLALFNRVIKLNQPILKEVNRVTTAESTHQVLGSAHRTIRGPAGYERAAFGAPGCILPSYHSYMKNWIPTTHSYEGTSLYVNHLFLTDEYDHSHALSGERGEVTVSFRTQPFIQHETFLRFRIIGSCRNHRSSL